MSDYRVVIFIPDAVQTPDAVGHLENLFGLEVPIQMTMDLDVACKTIADGVAVVFTVLWQWDRDVAGQIVSSFSKDTDAGFCAFLLGNKSLIPISKDLMAVDQAKNLPHCRIWSMPVISLTSDTWKSELDYYIHSHNQAISLTG